jgi:hypothetical protein
VSEGHHHGGDIGGQPGLQPQMFPHHEHQHHHIADPSDPMPPAYGPGSSGVRRSGMRRPRPRTGSSAWIGLLIVRLAVIAFIVYVAFQIFHGAASTPSP